MPDKQKVTLYLPDDLHRQFKIRSAVDGETMSSMAQRAIEFYLGNAKLVEESAEAYGRTHQIHSCPQCSAAVTLKEGELALVQEHGKASNGGLLGMGHISGLNQDPADGNAEFDSKCPGEGKLITC